MNRSVRVLVLALAATMAAQHYQLWLSGDAPICGQTGDPRSQTDESGRHFNDGFHTAAVVVPDRAIG